MFSVTCSVVVVHSSLVSVLVSATVVVEHTLSVTVEQACHQEDIVRYYYCTPVSQLYEVGDPMDYISLVEVD